MSNLASELPSGERYPAGANAPYTFTGQSHAPGTGQLAAALSKAQAKYPVINKDKEAKIVSERTGTSFTYKYAEWGQILDKTRPVLAAEELAFSQPIRHREGKQYLVSVLLHSSGEIWESQGLLIPGQLDSRALSAHLSYCKRLDGCALLGVAAEDDDTSQPEQPKPTARRERVVAPAPGPTEPPATAKETAQWVELLKPFKDLVGGDPLKAFVLKHAGVAELKKLANPQWQGVVDALTKAHANGEQALIALVNGG